jgi:hypothetical protein
MKSIVFAAGRSRAARFRFSGLQYQPNMTVALDGPGGGDQVKGAKMAVKLRPKSTTAA